MFNENLVESSPALRKRRRWPTFAAFAAQLAVIAALLIIPLFYAGAIPLTQRIPFTIPLAPAPVVKEVSSKMPAGGGGGTLYSHDPVLIAASTCLCPFHHGRATDDNDAPPPVNIGGGNDRLPIGPGDGPGDGGNVRLEKEKPITSQLDEGMLTHKVIPVYPVIARRIGLQGDVKLHAIIARDGTVQSLNLISGHPLLVPAAMDAVRQWKYRPYVLNGQAVEVETYITVTFRKAN